MVRGGERAGEKTPGLYCTCKIEVRENILHFWLIWPANYFIFHNFVYTD